MTRACYTLINDWTSSWYLTQMTRACYTHTLMAETVHDISHRWLRHVILSHCRLGQLLHLTQMTEACYAISLMIGSVHGISHRWLGHVILSQYRLGQFIISHTDDWGMLCYLTNDWACSWYLTLMTGACYSLINDWVSSWYLSQMTGTCHTLSLTTGPVHHDVSHRWLGYFISPHTDETAV